MNHVLYTDRLTLTPFDESDVDICIELFTNPEVVSYAGKVMAEDDIRSEFPKWMRRGGNGRVGIWCARDKQTDEKLGTGALLPMPIERKDTDFDLLVPDRMPEADIEIGYFLKPSAWGKGLATEISARLLRFAFEETPLTEVVASFDPENEASRNVLIKTGFVDCGMRRSYGENSPYYRVRRDDWLNAEG